MKKSVLYSLVVASVTLGALACGKTDSSDEKNTDGTSEEKKPDGTVKNSSKGAKIQLSVSPLASLRKGLSALNLATVAGNEGVGSLFSLAQVDGLKVKLVRVQAGNTPGGTGPQTPVFDWSSAPKEVEIKDGLNVAITEAGTLAPGTYSYFAVEVLNGYSLKAYAYHDVDKNGVLDASDDLVYTAKDGIKRVAGNILVASLPDYDYAENSFLYSHMAASGPTATAAFMNMLHEPLVVKDGDTLSGSVLIDSYRVVGSYNGRISGNNWSESWGPFNSANVGDGKTWPTDKPAFALQYLPMYALVKPGSETSAATGLRAESYVLGTDATFQEKSLQLATFIFDSENKPYAASTAIADGNDSPHLGQKIDIFAKDADGNWSFYDGAAMGTGARKAEWENGGFYYNPGKPELAMHKITGFKFLDTVGTDAKASIQNSPACWNEYRYCFPYDNMNSPTPKGGPGSGTGEASDTTKFDIFYKRVK